MAKGLIFALLMAAQFSWAGANQDHTCQGGHNCNGGSNGGNQQQGQAQGQAQWQGQAQGQISVNENQNTASVTSRTGAYSDSRSDSRSAAVVSGNSLQGGQSDANARASGGASSANSVISIDSSDRAVNPASSAATVYSDYCTFGASGQAYGGGAAITNQDPICEHMKVAEAMYSAWERMRAECKVPNNPACDYDKEAEYYHEYLKNYESMARIMSQTSITGQISKTSGQLVIPAALIWLLFIL